LLSGWTTLHWEVIQRFVSVQDYKNTEFPWSFKPLHQAQLDDVINLVRSDKGVAISDIEVTRRSLCDTHLLDRDSLGNYYLAYPLLIRDFSDLRAKYDSSSFDVTQRNVI